MPARRYASRVALLAVLVFVAFPRFSRGQSAASLEIDRALFMVATKGPDGKWAVRETDRVPLRPREACYGWRLHFSNNAPGEVAWRAEFTLPANPGKTLTLLETKKSEKPHGGWVGHTWCVTQGDPAGEHVIKVYVRDSLARVFTFHVVAPEDLVAQEPAGGGGVPPVDPLGQLGDFSSQRAALDAELEAKYPKPPKGLDTDPATASVLLLDIDRKGALSKVDGAAVVTRGDGGEPIRAAPMKGDLVMFHTLQPGTYSLRFIRVVNYKGGETQPSEVLVLEKPPFVEIDVTVPGGGVAYLGTVEVSRKKLGLFGFKPPEFQLTYDAKRELEAWLAFKKKYADSPWTTLAEKRIAALKSP
jgi:hypothetical protein